MFTRCGKETVTERHAGALPRAFAHTAAKPAVYSLVVFVFPDAKFRRVRADVTEHELCLLKNLRG